MSTVADCDALAAQLNVETERYRRGNVTQESIERPINASEARNGQTAASAVGPVRHTAVGGARRDPYRPSPNRTTESSTKRVPVSAASPADIQALQDSYQEKIAAAVYNEYTKIRAALGQELEAVKTALVEENRRLKEELQHLTAKIDRMETQNRATEAGTAAWTQSPRDPRVGGIGDRPMSQGTTVKTVNLPSVWDNRPIGKNAEPKPPHQEKPSETCWTKVTHRPKSKTPKSKEANQLSLEPTSRRLLFPREVGAPKKAEEDIFLGINEMLKKAGAPAFVRAERVSYSATGSVSVLLKEKAHTGLVLPAYKTGLIKAVKAVDPAVIGVEAIEQWHRLKVHGLSIERYGNGEEGMSLFQREIEASTDITLKTKPRWLFHPETLLLRWTEGGKPNSTIVITVGSEREAKMLCAKGLKLGRGSKTVEKYWEQGPGTVCQICCGIGHGKYGDCGDRTPQCIICAGAHKMVDHKCKVLGCTTQAGRVCMHDTVRCANCSGRHQASATKCPARTKAEIAAQSQRTNGVRDLSGESPTRGDEVDLQSTMYISDDYANPTSPLSEPPEDVENIELDDPRDSSCI
jgi:hypothetical protein